MEKEGWRSLRYVNQVRECLKTGLPIAVVDLETTGFNKIEDRVIQFSGRKVIVNKDLTLTEIETKAIYCNPGIPLPEKIIELTGITDAKLVAAPKESEVFPEIKAFLDGCIFCSHNATFDIGFVKSMFKRAKEEYDPPTLCTLTMSRELFTGSHKLSELAAKYGIDEGIAFHNAEADTFICVQLLQRFLVEYRDRKPATGEISPQIKSITFWKGWNHTQNRVYVNTNFGTVYFDQFQKRWYEKDKDMLNLFNMSALETEVLKLAGCADIEQLAKFKGCIIC